MPKARGKRSQMREEKKRKRAEDNNETKYIKRMRLEAAEAKAAGNEDASAEQYPVDAEQDDFGGGKIADAPEKEFFGMLADEEQEYFRRADELLELNQFPSSEDRQLFIDGVFKEAEGKELKLASSQSCSRLMERLIQLSTTAQKKKLFAAFAGHFLSLISHRFASHCCEALFLRSAGAVSTELAGGVGFVFDTKGGEREPQEPEAPMETLFLETLDELEGHLSYLLTDRFASHTLRVLLLVLSGRPLDDASLRKLLKSKKKENISVAGADAVTEPDQGLRAVPASFTTAVQKIIEDSISGIDATSLRVLAKHPIGNPTLQLLLELDLNLTKSDQKGESSPTLLFQLLPGAPKTLSDESSEASEFINGMVYDQIGSRLIETLITFAPGKIFKTLNQNIFLPRIQGYVRNDVSCYPAMRVLARLSKEDLQAAVEKIEPTVPQLVTKNRYNVLRTLFERCVARGASDEIKKLNKGLKQGCGSEPGSLVTTLCCLSEEEEGGKKKADVTQVSRNNYAIQSHGAQLLTTLLSIPGPSKGVQESLLNVPAPLLLQLAQASLPAVTVLTTALNTPSPNNPGFHKTIAAKVILPHVAELASSQYGHNLIVALVSVPSKGRERSVPFHMKDAVMAKLGEVEMELRSSWMGRSVWRNWKGDMWKTRTGDWKIWMREIDVVEEKPQRKFDERKPREDNRSAEVPKPEEDVVMAEANGDAPEEPQQEIEAQQVEDTTQPDASPEEETKEKKKKKKKKSKEEKSEKSKSKDKDKKDRKEKKKKKKSDEGLANGHDEDE